MNSQADDFSTILFLFHGVTNKKYIFVLDQDFLIDTADILGQVILCSGYCPVLWECFASSLASTQYMLHHPQLSQPKMFPNIAKVPWEPKSSPAKNHILNQIHIIQRENEWF